MLDWIVGFIEWSGYWGIALLMLAENLFPPIPSELIMPLAGFAAARGELGFVPAIVAGTAGSLLGAVFWYYVGQLVGDARLRRLAARHGRWLTLTPDEVDGVVQWFRARGGSAVLVGRLVPAVRTLISVPAGMASMPLWRFMAYSAAGTLAWTALLAAAGLVLGANYGAVSGWLNPVTDIVVAILAATYLYRVATFRRRTGGKG